MGGLYGKNVNAIAWKNVNCYLMDICIPAFHWSSDMYFLSYICITFLQSANYYLFAGQTSQLAPRMAATPKDDKCNMKIMRKHVVNKLSPYWSVVCQHLGYSTAGLVQDDKKNLIAVLEHWINSGEKEGKPRTWSMFMGVLSNISELSIVTSDICRDLNTAGVYFSE